MSTLFILIKAGNELHVYFNNSSKMKEGCEPDYNFIL